MASKEPYITFVATSRNDNHGGDLTRRMRIFVRGLIRQANKYQLPCELIMVEWNPPADRPLMHTVLPTPSKEDFLTVRYVVVPHEYHITLNNSDWLPLFQMIAKNVGIRRARGKFIACTNIDLLFSDELFRFLAARKLEKNHFYRCSRCDVPEEIDENEEIDALLSWCGENIMKRLGKNPAYPHLTNTNSYLFKHKIALPLIRMLDGLKYMLISPLRRKTASLDTWACGDFTLMHIEDWEKIEGYPELELYSLHIDSMGLQAAVAAGIKQVILPPDHCSYHISHYGGWELFDSPLDKLKFVAEKHMLNWEAVGEAGDYIIENGLGFGINEPDWGLKNVDLQEIEAGNGD